MKFFLHESSVDRSAIWSLLRDADRESGFSHLYDVVQAATSGSLSVNQEGFSLAAYNNKSEFNDKRSKQTNDSAYFIVSDVEREDGATRNMNTVSDTVLKQFDEALDSVTSEKTIMEGIVRLASMRTKLSIELGIDPLVSLHSSLQDNPGSLHNVSILVSHSEELAELFEDIATSITQLSESKGKGAGTAYFEKALKKVVDE